MFTKAKGAIEMKNSKKALLVGLAATAAVAAVAAVMAYEEETVDRIGSYLNRQRVKTYVKNKFKGNQRVLKAVDSLSDKEIDTLLAVLDRTGNWKDAAMEVFADMKDKAVDYKETVEDKFH